MKPNTQQYTPEPWRTERAQLRQMYAEVLADRDRLAAANARQAEQIARLTKALERIANEMQSASSGNRTVSPQWLDRRIAVARAALAGKGEA